MSHRAAVVPEVVSQPQSQDKPERVFQFIEDDDDFMVEESLRNRRNIVDGYQCRGEDPFLFIGERLPPITDFAAVGDLREFILPDTPAFEALANNVCVPPRALMCSYHHHSRITKTLTFSEVPTVRS